MIHHSCFAQPLNSPLQSGCDHAFHLPCLAIWTDSASTCPMCRAQLFSSRVLPIDYHRVARAILQASSDPADQGRNIVARLDPRFELPRNWNPTRYTILVLCTLSVYRVQESPLPDALWKELLEWVITAARVSAPELEYDDEEDVDEFFDDYDLFVRDGEDIEEMLARVDTFFASAGPCPEAVRREDLAEVWRGPGVLPPVQLVEWYDPRANAEAAFGVEWVLREERWRSCDEVHQRTKRWWERLKGWCGDWSRWARLGTSVFLLKNLDRAVAGSLFVDGLPGSRI